MPTPLGMGSPDCDGPGSPRAGVVSRPATALVVLSDLSSGLNCGSAGPAFRAAGKEGRHQCSADDA